MQKEVNMMLSTVLLTIDYRQAVSGRLSCFDCRVVVTRLQALCLHWKCYFETTWGHMEATWWPITYWPCRKKVCMTWQFCNEICKDAFSCHVWPELLHTEVILHCNTSMPSGPCLKMFFVSVSQSVSRPCHVCSWFKIPQWDFPLVPGDETRSPLFWPLCTSYQ